jgi:L-histidine N-alpha-methyltransferase
MDRLTKSSEENADLAEEEFLGSITQDRFSLINRKASTTESSLADEIELGLGGQPKSLPCRFLYDEIGSVLFEDICRLPEYYLTRAEHGILLDRAPEIAARFTEPITLVELGSGSSEKTRLLIDAFLDHQGDLTYVPIDISRHALVAGSQPLVERRPRLHVRAIAGEYENAFEVLSQEDQMPRVILWLGSSAGNFQRSDASAFLCRVRAHLNPADCLLVGIDLRKDRERLESAYNDSQGVTARFNKNLLGRINRELGGDFDPDRFAFQARYHEDSGSVESSLLSLTEQRVKIETLGRSFEFGKGEAIHTEDSHKYSFAEIDDLAQKSDMRCEERWLDSDARFSLNLFRPV